MLTCLMLTCALTKSNLRFGCHSRKADNPNFEFLGMLNCRVCIWRSFGMAMARLWYDNPDAIVSYDDITPKQFFRLPPRLRKDASFPNFEEKRPYPGDPKPSKHDNLPRHIFIESSGSFPSILTLILLAVRVQSFLSLHTFSFSSAVPSYEAHTDEVFQSRRECG